MHKYNRYNCIHHWKPRMDVTLDCHKVHKNPQTPFPHLNLMEKTHPQLVNQLYGRSVH